jgi:hypothetical protein
MKVGSLLLAVVLWSACSCKNGDKSTGGLGGDGGTGKPPPTTGHTAAECDGLTEALTKLYATPAPPDESPEAAALRRQEQSDNVNMVLTDCRKDPNRVIPCAKTATNTDQLERACMLPLDDDGNVEQQQFGKPR